jgi:hypothetical protein
MLNRSVENGHLCLIPDFWGNTYEKTEESLSKRLKSCERNMQELFDSIQRPNLQIMSTEEEEGQAKGIHNIFKQ